MNYEEIVERVKKLLALGTSPNQHEAALAQAKAAELMLKYSIDRGSIDTKESKDDEPVSVFVFETDEGNKTTWKGSLASAIANFFNCQIYWSGPTLMFVGRASDRNSVLYLYNAIFNQIQELTEKFWIKEGIRSGIHGKSWKQGFRLGCVSTLRERFAQQKNTIMMEYRSQGNSLVVFNQLAMLVAAKVSNLGLRSAAPTVIKAGSAYSSGKREGHSVNIGNNQGIGNRSIGLPNKG